MYLKAPPKTWYDSTDRLSHKERLRTEDQKLESVYKDNVVKKGEDPLAMMNAYLKRRDDVKAAQERQRADPWADTPRTLASETPIAPTLLAKRKGRRRSPSPLANVEAGPAKPQAAPTLQSATAIRESSERERAKALLAAKRGRNSETPVSEFGYQTGMYNRDYTRQAKSNYSNVGW
jgi:hypothetical protein